MIPLGGLITETETVPVNPPSDDTVNWVFPEVPRLTVSEEAEIEKSPVDCPVPVSFSSNGLYGPPVWAAVTTPLIVPPAANELPQVWV